MPVTIISLVNGEVTDQISLHDRGLLYGDGCFETIAVRQGQALLWERHLQRLMRGCTRLGIDCHGMPEVLLAEADKIINATDEGVLKIIITRGAGRRGYRTDDSHKPTRILSISPLPHYANDFRHEGIAMRLCDTRLSENKTLAGIKHLNRLEQVLARAEWQDQYQEGLMLNQSGQVIEGTMSNIFVQIGDEVITPTLEKCGVAGVMRDVIINKLTAENIDCQQRQFDLATLYRADAIFICNSIIGLWPVTSVEDNLFAITELQKTLQTAINDDCV